MCVNSPSKQKLDKRRARMGREIVRDKGDPKLKTQGMVGVGRESVKSVNER